MTIVTSAWLTFLWPSILFKATDYPATIECSHPNHKQLHATMLSVYSFSKQNLSSTRYHQIAEMDTSSWCRLSSLCSYIAPQPAYRPCAPAGLGECASGKPACEGENGDAAISQRHPYNRRYWESHVLQASQVAPPLATRLPVSGTCSEVMDSAKMLCPCRILWQFHWVYASLG